MQHDYYVTFEINCKWVLNAGAPTIYPIQIGFPNQFDNLEDEIYINLNEPTRKFTQNFSQKMTSKVIESIIQEPFLFQFILPATSNLTATINSHSQNDRIQVDAWPLLLENRTSITINSKPPNFKSLSIIISIDRPILSQHYLRIFTPVFVTLVDVINMPDKPYSFEEMEEKYIPVYFICKISDRVYTICHQVHQLNHLLDVVIPVSPREQQEIVFEIHDKETIPPNPSFYVGSGYITFLEPKQSEEKTNPCGYCNIKLLPERKRTVNFQMVTNEGPIPGCNTQFHYEIKDPMDGASVSSGGFDKVAKNDKGFEIEPPSSKFFRWIFSFSKESSTETFNLFLQDIIAENQQNLPDDVLIYDDCVKTSIDLITGFHFETPCEHLYVLESRATSPNLFSKKIVELISDAPEIIHIVADTNHKFNYPRIYHDLERVFLHIDCPIPMHELLRLDGLYYHNSPNHDLFSIINKFENLLNVNTLSLPPNCYPTKDELQHFSVKMMELPMIPLQSNLNISPRRRFSTDIQNYAPVTQYTEKVPERFVSATTETTPRRKAAPILKIAYPKRKIRVPNKQLNHSLTLASLKHANTPNKYYRVTASTDFFETEPVVTATKTRRRANSVRKDNSGEPKVNLEIRAPDTPKHNPRFSKI